jgi:two-component system nitrogen regulation response regulator NtrX
MSAHLLIVDDEPNLRLMLQQMLELAGYDVRCAASGEDALLRVEEDDFDVILLDVRMAGLDGLSTLKRLRTLEPTPEIIMMSGHGSIETAVEAVRAGALDFLEKPLTRDRVLLGVEFALRARKLARENRRLRQATQGQGLLGDSSPMRALRDRIAQVGRSDARILIRGESGTGKELVAQAIHANSLRANEAFIATNCAAIPADLIESELFGHSKGAFTGASAARAGVFEIAHGGTLFLDEIGDMPLAAQSKLLRVLETGTLSRVGSHREIRVDVRVVAATHRELKQMIEQGGFREDLYHRLHVIPIDVPPLRARVEDISLLAENFLAREVAKQKLPLRRFSASALKCLGRYAWPGNVRELKNFVERLAILSRDEIVDDAFVEAELPGDAGAMPQTLREAVEQTERGTILGALRGAEGNVSEAARRLGLERSHLYKKAKSLGLSLGEPG